MRFHPFARRSCEKFADKFHFAMEKRGVAAFPVLNSISAETGLDHESRLMQTSQKAGFVLRLIPVIATEAASYNTLNENCCSLYGKFKRTLFWDV
jgi:hypothetical protein